MVHIPEHCCMQVNRALALLMTTLLFGCSSVKPAPERIELPSVADTKSTIPIPAESKPLSVETTLGKEVTVWYGTSRKPLPSPASARVFGKERDYELHVGTCRVFIPQSHERGSLGSWTSYVFTHKDAPIRLRNTIELDRGAFWSSIKGALAELPASEKRVVLFIHGYNNSFEDAAIRMGQMWTDLGITGIPAFFSWPSRDNTLNYTFDEATAEASERFLREFLEQIQTKINPESVHIIAHSMGNRILLRTINRTIADARHRSSIRFGQIILAAPDVDRDVFEDLARAYPLISEGTTVYVSRKDEAVHFSEDVHFYPRVGAPPPFVHVPKVDTVEVVAPRGLLDLGHGYFAEFVPVLNDIRSLVMTKKPIAARRFDTLEHRWVLGE